jgi:hypothetical protein
MGRKKAKKKPSLKRKSVDLASFHGEPDGVGDGRVLALGDTGLSLSTRTGAKFGK